MRGDAAAPRAEPGVIAARREPRVADEAGACATLRRFRSRGARPPLTCLAPAGRRTAIRTVAARAAVPTRERLITAQAQVPVTGIQRRHAPVTVVGIVGEPPLRLRLVASALELPQEGPPGARVRGVDREGPGLLVLAAQDRGVVRRPAIRPERRREQGIAVPIEPHIGQCQCACNRCGVFISTTSGPHNRYSSMAGDRRPGH